MPQPAYFLCLSFCNTNSYKKLTEIISKTNEAGIFRRTLIIGASIAWSLGHSALPCVYAETMLGTYSTSQVITLEPVIVSSRRSETPVSDVAEGVEVYTQKDIQNIPARDLGEALTYVAGVDMSVRSQFGQGTNLSIRGSESRHVLVMVDGIPFNTQLSGQANPTKIPLEHIQRIEVIKGAASSAWGSVLGGVVNVITKDVGSSQTPHGSTTFSFAEFATFKESFDLAGKVADLGYLVVGSFLETEGPREATDTSEIKAFAKLSHPVGDQAKLTASFGYSGADVLFGVTPKNRINSQPYISRYGKLSLDVDKDRSKTKVAYKYNDQDITTDIFNASTGALVSSTVSKNFYQGLSINNSTQVFEDDLLVMGADFEWHRLKSNNFLDTSKSVRTQAPYVNYTLRWDQWDFIPGVRYDHNQQFGSQTSPSFGVIYHFQDKGKTLLRAKVARTFNAPPLLWVYNSDPALFVGPNPDLEPERSTVYEAGIKTKVRASLDVELNVYRADVKDAIAVVFDNTNFVFVQENFKKFKRQGAELILNYQLNDQWSFYGSGAVKDVQNRETGETVRDSSIAKQSFTMGMNYKSQNGFGAHLHGYYNLWSSDPDDEPNDQKFIFDLRLIKEFKNVKKDIDLETFLNIHNVTNSKYWSDATFPLPERYFEGGFSLIF